MEPYKGYFTYGSALMTHPFIPDWYVCGSVYVPPAPIVQSWRLRAFSFSGSPWALKELAEWFGLEVARIVVDECLAPRENW